MSTIDSINRTMIRLSGLSSGLDTDSIVSDLLKIDQMKLDNQFKIKTKLEWKSQAYRDINLQLLNFRQQNMSVLNAESNMLSTAAYNTFEVNMLTETNAVTVSAGSGAYAGTVTIDSITQLAEAATASSASVFTEDISLSTPLAELPFATPLVFDEGEISFSINGETFTFGEDADLSTVISAVNANTSANVSMRYSSLKKGFVITQKNTGSENGIDIVNIKGNAFASGNSAFGIEEGTYSGKDALLSIDGVAVTRSTNAFTIDGISYSLKDESATAITFGVERDIDATFDKIKTFIESYNELIGSLQAELDEEVYSDYGPLTDEEREALTETQQTQWEEKAKSGLLRYDSNIERLLNNMRNAFYTAVESAGVSPMEIGLKTGSYTDKGKITIDEDALREALENDPELVTRVFTSTSNSTDAGIKYSESGLVTRISDAVSQYTESVTSITLANNDAAVSSAQKRLDELQRWLNNQEDRYWAKFTAMETALSKLNAQSEWLANQISAMTQS